MSRFTRQFNQNHISHLHFGHLGGLKNVFVAFLLLFRAYILIFHHLMAFLSWYNLEFLRSWIGHWTVWYLNSEQSVRYESFNRYEYTVLMEKYSMWYFRERLAKGFFYSYTRKILYRLRCSRKYDKTEKRIIGADIFPVQSKLFGGNKQ